MLEFLYSACCVKKKMSKKSVAHERSWGSSSTLFDTMRFVSIDAEALFHDSMKRRAGLKERGLILTRLNYSTSRLL